MSTGLNTDLQSKLTQAMGQLSSLNGSVGSTGAGSSSNYVNSIWGLAQEGQNAIDGGDSQKAQAIVNMVQNLLGMLSSLGTNETSKANKEVNKNDKAASDVENGAKASADKTQAEIESIKNDIKNNNTDIKTALAKIQELGGNQEDITKAQEDVKDQIRVIDENLRIINDGVSNQEAKDNALKAIKSASIAISNITSTIVFLTEENQEAIQEQTSIVENAANNISSLIEKSATTLTNGTADLEKYAKEAGNEITTNATSSQTGKINEETGKAATKAGTSTTSIPFVNLSSAKLLQIGADQTFAGGIRILSSTKNISTLTKAIGVMGSDLTHIVGSTQEIQGVGSEATELLGQYQTKLSSIITATGSWTQVVDANIELNQAIAEYEGQNVDYTKSFDSKNNSTEQTNQTSYQAPWAQYAKQNSQEQQNKTLEFDTQKFKKAFGI